MRIALMVEYDGSPFHGWQAQHGLYTVQGVLEQAIERVANHSVAVVAAGRTDTGVHATNQYVHFDSTSVRSTRAWIHGVNSHLPKEVCVTWAKEVSETFHARYSALARRYCYLIYNAAVRPALWCQKVTWQYRPLDHEMMHQAGQYLLGEQDFTSFRSIECQSNTPMRNVHQLNVTRRGDLLIIDITANAFLHHMVRNIAGVLMAVGSGRRSMEWVAEVLRAKDRTLGAETAPPYGLYLTGVTYPSEFGITQQVMDPFHFF